MIIYFISQYTFIGDNKTTANERKRKKYLAPGICCPLYIYVSYFEVFDSSISFVICL